MCIHFDLSYCDFHLVMHVLIFIVYQDKFRDIVRLWGLDTACSKCLAVMFLSHGITCMYECSCLSILSSKLLLQLVL